MNVHFIAIGGSAMHNLAIALSRKGINVTGSDDEIFEPSRTRLEKQNILPNQIGWFPEKITSNLDAVILGMHAREDNPELQKAKELNIPVFSYPEYLYEQAKNKHRIVIGGSHGKTTITSMLLHVVKELNLNVDYMVGAQLDGYDCMVKLSEDAKFMILEGDEYLSSPIDRRPKFHLYAPNTALISGIAWDHINVFPTWENYIEQFDVFCQKITPKGTLVYSQDDETVKLVAERADTTLTKKPYSVPNYRIENEKTILTFNSKEYRLLIFGEHNLQNLMGAMYLAESMDISNDSFLTAIQSFTGAGKRLQKVVENDSFLLFKDFAHSPSKLKATTKAVKEQYADKKVIACMELHTFSSLRKDFLPLYKGAMNAADVALVYFSHEVIAHKKLDPLTIDEVQNNFGGNVRVVTDTKEVIDFIHQEVKKDSVLLMMSSGNFDGIDYDNLGQEIIKNLAI
jgi:UDP-N-acetylmuramate: L-alanyl-gamma-D-glutamyl-meso-diaminopimelate ligase